LELVNALYFRDRNRKLGWIVLALLMFSQLRMELDLKETLFSYLPFILPPQPSPSSDP